MGLFGKSKAEKIAEFKEKQSMLNGKELEKTSNDVQGKPGRDREAYWQET